MKRPTRTYLTSFCRHLDDGQLTDSLGRRVDFRNTIIIMTSNIGARQLQDFGTGVGFSTDAKKTKESDDRRGVIQNALKRAFAPEFLNRIDDVIVFNSLKRPDIHRIIDLELSKLFGRIESLGYSISLTDAAKDFLVDKGYDEQFGARPLRRALQKYLEDPLAEEIISAQLTEGDKIEGDAMEGQEDLAIRIIKGSEKPKKKRKPAAKAAGDKGDDTPKDESPEATEDNQEEDNG